MRWSTGLGLVTVVLMGLGAIGAGLEAGDTTPELRARDRAATIGAKCTTRAGAFAALMYFDAEKMTRMFLAQDAAAIQKMITENRVIMLKVGLPMFVEQRADRLAEVRRQGETFTVWMYGYDLDCPSAMTMRTK
jgi:hypothetical protein